MTLSFYQSCRTVPPELKEAVAMFQLSSWQSFWRLDVPFAMPGLIWNCMMSMSASWFFVVASEAITSFNPNITLPGIGSYIGAALPQANLHAVFYAIIAMFFVILIYDQLLFRPLSQWIERFTFEEDDDVERPESWVVNLFARTRLMQYLGATINRLWDRFVTLPLFKVHYTEEVALQPSSNQLWLGRVLHTIVIFIATTLLFWLAWIVFDNIPWREGLHVAYLGCITGTRVMVLIFLSSLVWVPIGVWIGLRPALSQVAQPIIQFLAAFPANLFYPVMVVLITTYDLNADIWTSPLIILGTQWYILFNVIVGTIALPKTYKYVAKNFHLKGWLWWKRLILPGIFPYYVTGAITAAGGAWNASVVAECLHWGSKKVQATGLGNYIANSYETGDSHRLALGIVIMCIFVVTINRFLWRPLYNMAERRFVIGE
jgi:NitT/TauT family transport system permease protein